MLVVAHSSLPILAPVYSDGSGDVEMTLRLPEGLRPGDHSISVEGAGAGGDRLMQGVPRTQTSGPPHAEASWGEDTLRRSWRRALRDHLQALHRAGVSAVPKTKAR